MALHAGAGRRRDGAGPWLRGEPTAFARPFRRRLDALIRLACLAGAGSLALSPASGHAQVLQQWSHQAVFGDASAVVAMDDTLMFVADNEDEVLRLYLRYPGSACAAAVYSLDARPNLGTSQTNPEVDLEAAVKLTDGPGTRIYWLGSHSNSRTGNLRPNRYRLFATQVGGNGTGSPPYSLTYVGRYDHLRDDLIFWDRNNVHGLGANYFGL